MDGSDGRLRIGASLARPTAHFDPAQYDSGGLIWGYRLADGSSIGLQEAERDDASSPLWIHLNLSDGRARKWLTEHARLPAAALAMLLDPQPRVRVQTLAEGVVATIEDLHHDFKGDPEGFGELRFYMDERRVVSARRHPLKSVDVLHRSLQQGLTMSASERWLDQLVECVAHSFGEAVHTLVDQVDELEDEIVTGSNKDQRATLSSLRRLLVRFRRHLNADRSALGKLRSTSHDASHQLTPLRQALEHLDGVASDLDLVHERVRLLQDEVAGLLAEATNRNLYVLSIVTTALLPATLMTGFWGMNVGGLPWQDDAHGIWWTGLTVVASIVFSLALLRGSRVL